MQNLIPGTTIYSEHCLTSETELSTSSLILQLGCLPIAYIVPLAMPTFLLVRLDCLLNDLSVDLATDPSNDDIIRLLILLILEIASLFCISLYTSASSRISSCSNSSITSSIVIMPIICKQRTLSGSTHYAIWWQKRFCLDSVSNCC